MSLSRKILLAVPTPEFVNPECYESILEMRLTFVRKYPDVKLGFAKAGGVRTDTNRNIMLQEFMKDDYDAILYLDADMTYPPDMLIKFYENNYDVQGCLYFQRSTPYKPIIFRFSGNKKSKLFEIIDPRKIKDGDHIEVDALGTGGLWIKRHVVDKLKELGDEWFHYGGNFHLPFEAEDKVGHDLDYCARIRKAGFKIVCDASVQPKHIGKLFIDKQTWLDWIEKHPSDGLIYEPKKCTLIIPTVHRPEQLEELLVQIRNMTQYKPYDIYVIAEGKETIDILKKAKKAGHPVSWTEVKEYQGYAKSINMGVEANPESFYYVYMADDVMPGKDWLSLAIGFMTESFSQLDGLVCFNDGKWHGQNACHALFSRNTITSLGNSKIMFEGYKHYHPDRELTLVATSKGKYGYCPMSVLWHNQVNVGRADADEITERAFSTEKEDTKLFNDRKAAGFSKF